MRTFYPPRTQPNRFEHYLRDWWIEEDNAELFPVAVWKSEPKKKGIAVPAKQFIRRFTSRQEAQGFINSPESRR